MTKARQLVRNVDHIHLRSRGDETISYARPTRAGPPPPLQYWPYPTPLLSPHYAM